jgi:signal-transduction protein with cAMP-binding, CBS, and nucleotidyltransferase domain
VGWFLQRAATSSREQHTLHQALSQARVENIMSREIRPISPQATLTDFIHEVLYLGLEPAAYIEDGHLVKGIISLEDLRGIPSYLWDTTPVEQVMKPVHPEGQINPGGTLLEAMQAMDHSEQVSLPVMYNGIPLGMISKEQVLSYLRTRLESK